MYFNLYNYISPMQLSQQKICFINNMSYIQLRFYIHFGIVIQYTQNEKNIIPINRYKKLKANEKL